MACVDSVLHGGSRRNCSGADRQVIFPRVTSACQEFGIVLLELVTLYALRLQRPIHPLFVLLRAQAVPSVSATSGQLISAVAARSGEALLHRYATRETERECIVRAVAV